ncbi:hypothetical protein FQR65_LT19581 [Abscondita terminalis]|nr:hypothetical protein FQR65_LT19581 [Abscondita terminalis]
MTYHQFPAGTVGIPVQKARQFSADASHELRTPLAVIKGTLEILIRKQRTIEEYENKIGYTLKQADRLSQLVEQFLLLARIENDPMEIKKSKPTPKGLSSSFALLSAHAQKVVWEKTLGGKHSEYLFDMVPTVDYGFLLAGSSFSDKTGSKTSEGQGNLDYWLWKMDKDGEKNGQKSFWCFGAGAKNWQKTLGRREMDRSGERSNAPLGALTWLYYHRSDTKLPGKLLWEKTFGGIYNDEVKTIVPTKDGFIIGAQSNSPIGANKAVDTNGGYDIWLLTLDHNGNLLQQHSYGGTADDFLTDLLPVDNGYLLAGTSSFRKAVVTKTVSGRKLKRFLDGNSTGKTSALKKGYQGRNDYWIVKLNTKEKTKTPEIQIEAFPNPTEGFTNVVINHEYEEGQMILSDLSGKVLHTAPLQYDMIAVDLSGYPQGVYIINIKTNVINRSVKVIKK